MHTDSRKQSINTEAVGEVLHPAEDRGAESSEEGTAPMTEDRLEVDIEEEEEVTSNRVSLKTIRHGRRKPQNKMKGLERQ